MSDGRRCGRSRGRRPWREFRPGEPCRFPASSPQWQDGLPSGTSVQTSPARQAMAIDGLLPRHFFGTGQRTAFHATRPRGWSHAEGRDHYHGRCHCVADAGRRRGKSKTGDTVLVLGNRRAFSIAALQIAKMMGAAGLLPRRRLNEKFGTCPHPSVPNHVINYRQVPDWGEAGARPHRMRRRSCRLR